MSASTTSSSQNSSMWSRRSTTVTLLPRAAKIDAYSIPMTPAPTTTSDAGTRSSPRIPSESTTVRPSNPTFDGRAGRVPVAITMWLGGDRQLAALVGDDDGVLVDETRRAVEELDPVARQLVLDDLVLPRDHLRGAPVEVRHRDVGLDAVALPVGLAVRQAGQVEDRLAKRLRRDRPGVDAYAADRGRAFDDRGALAQFRGRDGRLLPTRATANREQVVVEHAGDLGASVPDPVDTHSGTDG